MFLDTGATNHMTGSEGAFVELDHSATGKVRFADEFVVEIHECGTVFFTDKEGDHRAFTDVYFIQVLKSSVVSVGQLDEGRFDINIQRHTTSHVQLPSYRTFLLAFAALSYHIGRQKLALSS